MRQRNGFTLIELLVVVAIIALLASMALVALSQSRVKARNAVRKTDIAQVRKALEIYYQDQSPTGYPTPAGCASRNGTSLSSLSGVVPYLSNLPKDPQNPDANGSPDNYGYKCFNASATNSGYRIYVPYEPTPCSYYYSPIGSSISAFYSEPDCID